MSHIEGLDSVRVDDSEGNGWVGDTMRSYGQRYTTVSGPPLPLDYTVVVTLKDSAKLRRSFTLPSSRRKPLCRASFIRRAIATSSLPSRPLLYLSLSCTRCTAVGTR